MVFNEGGIELHGICHLGYTSTLFIPLGAIVQSSSPQQQEHTVSEATHNKHKGEMQNPES